MDKLILNTITPDELREIIHSEVNTAMEKFISVTINNEELMTRQDVADLFHISLTTVDEWSKKGTLTRYEVESRIYFKRSEILKVLSTKSSDH